MPKTGRIGRYKRIPDEKVYLWVRLLPCGHVAPTTPIAGSPDGAWRAVRGDLSTCWRCKQPVDTVDRDFIRVHHGELDDVQDD